MKLLRYGPAGKEKPGLLDRDGVIRDLSGVVADITGETLAPRKISSRLLGQRAAPHQRDFHPYRVPGDRAVFEIGIERQLRYLPFGVGALEQHVLERELHEPAVHGADVQSIDIGGDLLPGSILAQIDDDGLAARFQYAVHFVERFQRFGKILERRAAHNQVK